MVRMDEDLTATPDFVKLDLQGGELEAIKGMGRFLSDVKVLYVEAQLNMDNDACQYLAENGFNIFFDKFQFGLRAGQIEVPILKLEKLGIRIDKMRLPSGTGMPLIFWGYLENGRNLFQDYSFTQEVREIIKEAGIGYFQTDAICVNTKYSDKIYPHFHKII